MGSIKLKSVEFNWQSRSMQYHSVYIQLTASVIFSFSSLSIFWVCSSTLGAPSKATRTILMLSVLPCKTKNEMETLKKWLKLTLCKQVSKTEEQTVSRLSYNFIWWRTNEHNSSLLITSQMPSQANIKNSSNSLRGWIVISGSGETSCSQGPKPWTYQKKWINTNKYKQLKTLPACTGNLQEHAKQPMSH